MMMMMMNQQQQCHLYAQKLNNRAALCIEIGHYDRAIASLAKALRLSSSAGNNNNSNNSDQHQHQHQQYQHQEHVQVVQPVCHCNCCSLDGCIAYSESISATEELTQQMAMKNITTRSSSTSTGTGTDCSSTSSFLSQHNKSFLSQQQQQQHNNNNDNNNDSNSDLDYNSLLSDDTIYGCGYIYRRPIRITSRTIQEGHNMGSTLFLIITFNLALAHHLSAVSAAVNNGSNSNSNTTTTTTTTTTNANEKSKIKKTLQLYEISNKWHIQSSNCHIYNDGDDDSGYYNKSRMMTQEQQQQQHQHQQQWNKEYSSSSSSLEGEDASTVSSIRFNMIICNNLSHIHCLVSNHSKHRQCLEHLLSQVMVALEYKTRTPPSSNSSRRHQQQQQQQHYGYDYGYGYGAAAEDYTLLMDLDGFLQSASSLILQEKCAKAA
jgi:hypothetical protein